MFYFKQGLEALSTLNYTNKKFDVPLSFQNPTCILTIECRYLGFNRFRRRLMTDKKPFRYFQCFAVSVVLLFFSIMGVVTIVAYTRKSGQTGLNMALVQKIRSDANLKP